MELRKKDRILVLEKEDPKNKDTGLIDPAVFEGKNNLHLIVDMFGLWSFKYERGVVPSQLKNKFSSFREAYNTAEGYFKTKKIKITKVID